MKRIAWLVLAGVLASGCASNAAKPAQAPSAAAASEEAVSSERDNALLAQVLKYGFGNHPSAYTVLNPMTRLSHVNFENAQGVEQTRQYILKALGGKAEGVPALVDQLFARNRKPVRLSLKSAPDDGYIVDDGKYLKYFKGGGGWEQWYKDHPEARGLTTVSLPAHDEKSGLLLVYIGTQRDWLDGAGFVVLFRRDKDGLHELGAVQLWVS